MNGGVCSVSTCTGVNILHQVMNVIEVVMSKAKTKVRGFSLCAYGLLGRN